MPFLVPALVGLGAGIYGYFKGSEPDPTIPRQPGPVEAIVDDSASIAKWAVIGLAAYLVAKKLKVI